MGLQSAFGKPRQVGITEAAFMKYGTGRVHHMFSNILQSDVEKALLGNITPEALLKTAMSESRLLHFTRGVLIPGDVEQQVLLQYIEGIAKSKNIVSQKKLLDMVSTKLEKGERWGSWNVGFDFGELYKTAKRTGNKKFINLYHRALDEDRIVDLAEGVHKYMYETKMSDFKGFEVLHREAPWKVERTLEDVLLAATDPEKVAKKWLVPHAGLTRLKDKQTQLLNDVQYNLANWDEFKAWREAVGVNKGHMAPLFKAGEEMPDMRMVRGWSTKALKRTLQSRITQKQFAERITGRLGISAGLLKHHDPRFDLGLEHLLVDIFDKWDSRSSGAFETELKGWGFKNRTDFHTEWAKQDRFLAVQQTIKEWFIKHSPQATKLARTGDLAHTVKLAKTVLDTHTMEGLAIGKSMKEYDTSFLKKGFSAGFKDAGQEIFTAAQKFSKIHPRMSMILGIGGGLFLLDSLIPSKAKKATKPYENIEGRRYAYSMWQQERGIRPSLIGPPTDFGSARSWWSQLSKAGMIFETGHATGGLLTGMGETERMLLMHGERYARQELFFAEASRIMRNITRRAPAKQHINPSVYAQNDHILARQPLDDMATEALTDVMKGKRNPIPHPKNIHALSTRNTKVTDLMNAIRTPTFNPSESPTMRHLRGLRRQDNIIRDWGMETSRGSRTKDYVEHHQWLKHQVGLEPRVDVTQLSEAVLPHFPERNFIPPTMPQVAFESEAYISSRLMERAGDRITGPFYAGLAHKPVQFPPVMMHPRMPRGSLHAHRPDMLMGMQREGLLNVAEDLSPFVDQPSKALSLERAPLNIGNPRIEGIRATHSGYALGTRDSIWQMTPRLGTDFSAGRLQYFPGASTAGAVLDSDYYDTVRVDRAALWKLVSAPKTMAGAGLKADLSGLMSGDPLTLSTHFNERHYKQYIKLLQTEYGHSANYAKYVVEHHLGMVLDPVNRVPKSTTEKFKGFFRGTIGGLFKGGANIAATPFRGGFWGPAFKTAWSELRAFPGYARDIWRSGLPLSKRMFWMSEAFLGFGSEKPPTAMRLAISRGDIKGPMPPSKFIWNPTLQEGKMWMHDKLMNWADRISGGDKAQRGARGFVSRRVRNVGKFAKYARGQTVLNMAMLGMNLVRSSEYNSKVGGMISETAAFTGGFAAFTAGNVVASRAVEAGLVGALGKAVLPGWAKVAVFAAGFIVGEKAWTSVDEFIRKIGHGIFGTATPMTNPQAMEQMMRPDYWNAHVAYKNHDGYSAFDGINVSGKNLTPFRSSYDAEAEPALVQPRMRKRVRRTRFPRTSGLVQVLWATRSGSKVSASHARSSPLPTIRSMPKPRSDRGVAA